MSEVESLLVQLEPVTPSHTVDDVSELLLHGDYERFLCLPVVDAGRPIGVISRSEMQKIYMSMYGRELYGKKSVTQFMNRKAVVVDMKQPMEQISRYVTSNIKFPITEDFILTRDGQYSGIGHVVDLLKVMEGKLTRQSEEITRAYRELQASQSQLIQSEKMASLGQMVAGVAHEINTPLGYVKNNVSLAQDVFAQLKGLVASYDELLALLMGGEAEETAVVRYLGEIDRQRNDFWSVYPAEEVDNLFGDTLFGVDQISEIVLNLKNFSRLDQAAVDEVSLNQTIESTLVIAKNVLKNKVELIKQYGEIPAVKCSPSQINQVFLNLLTNAAQAMDGNGKILIRTWADERYVYASVQDTGKGISKENLQKIFDPFFTTKPVGEGTGLGLSIVFKIIESHKGFIRVASEVGKGTRFIVALPHPKDSRHANKPELDTAQA